ncbi:protein ACCELERATED CELL DEATH 6-like [Apium graveolens]|uniref:protein ACCELERATED CELL DEATH 6-like n=1 Tax=Apium graveolens TaxID=4045 RepID=UPI003D7C0B22
MTMDIDALFSAAIAGDTDAKKQMAMIADHVSGPYDRTILHDACIYGNAERVKFMVTEFADENLLVKLDKYENTPLYLAAIWGHTEVVGILIDAARRIWPSPATTDDSGNSPSRVEDFLRQANSFGNTALHYAVCEDDVATVELLVNADRNDRHIQNQQGETPMYAAVERGHYDIVKLICKICTAPSLDGPQGTTALHLAIRKFHQGTTDKDIVMVLMDSAKRSSLSADRRDNYYRGLFIRTDNQNETIISLAVMTNNLDLVKLILKESPEYEDPYSIKYSDLKSVISTASREGYKDIFEILCEKYEAGDDDHSCYVLLTEAIKEGKKELVHDLFEYDKHLAAFEDPTSWTALHYAAFNKFDEIIEAIVSVQRDISYKYTYKSEESPLTLAVRKGYISTAVLLMNLLPATLSVYTDQKDKNVLHIAVERSKKDMIKTILAHCPRSLIYKILNGQDEDSNTPLHLLAAKGFFVPELIKHNSVDMMARNKQGQTPSDMLYSQEEVEADQAKIKKLLDDAPATRQFWRIYVRGRWSTPDNPGDTTKRLLKDLKFGAYMTDIVEEELQQWKEKIKPYRERTTTQIIVTALITTVTFTVGFTMPGGYHQSGEPEEGPVLLSKKKAFEVFMVSDASALALSITSLFIYFISSLYDDPHQVSKFDFASTVLNILSVIAMILTFIAGIYVVLSHSPGLALIVCIICSTFFLSLVVLLIKMMCDCKRRKIKI